MAEDFHYYEPTARIHSWRVLAFFAVAIEGERERPTPVAPQAENGANKNMIIIIKMDLIWIHVR